MATATDQRRPHLPQPALAGFNLVPTGEEDDEVIERLRLAVERARLSAQPSALAVEDAAAL